MFIGTRFLTIFLFLLGVSLSALGYTKFKFMERSIKSDLSLLSVRPPFCLDKADYSYTDNREGVKNYVFLTDADKKKINKALAQFDRQLAISAEMIQRYRATGRLNNNMVGLILQDFCTHHPDVTIGYVLDSLKK